MEPQIIIGLLVDQNGFPLGLQSFEGNKAETKTMLPVIQDFLAQNGLTKTTIVADAAMMNAPNLAALSEAGYTYIVGSRLHKVPYDIAEYQKAGELNDQQIVVEKREDYRVIYQYRAKRADLDKRNIEKQMTKAKLLRCISPLFLRNWRSARTLSKRLELVSNSLYNCFGQSVQIS